MNDDENAQRIVRADRLADLAMADHAWVVYARLQSMKELQTKEQKPFLVAELADVDTVIEAKIWSDREEAMATMRRLPLLTTIKLLGRVQEYKGRPQLIIERVRAVDASDHESFDPAQLVDPALEKVEDLVCRTLVVDIETVPATDRRELPAAIGETLTTFATRKEPNADKDVVDARAQMVMSLSPFFGKVVSLAVGDGDAEPGSGDDEVTVLAVPPDDHAVADPPPWLRLMSEQELLRCFWALASKAEVVVTFNGRSFDLPFLVARSLIHGIPARRDLLSSRFTPRPHLDLWEMLSQKDRGPSKLEVVCWALGIASPKGEMDGSKVAPAYARGEIVKIAEYNAHDVRATAAVFRKVRDLVLRFRADWN